MLSIAYPNLLRAHKFRVSRAETWTLTLELSPAPLQQQCNAEVDLRKRMLTLGGHGDRA